jgi:hypothetical protein
MFPGHDEGPDEQLRAVLTRAGQADIVINYIANTGARSWPRRVISQAFVLLMNRLFGLRLRDYNGAALHRTEQVRQITIRTDSFAYRAEASSSSSGRDSYVEVGTPIAPQATGKTKAFSPRNRLDVGRALVRLPCDVRR